MTLSPSTILKVTRFKHQNFGYTGLKWMNHVWWLCISFVSTGENPCLICKKYVCCPDFGNLLCFWYYSSLQLVWFCGTVWWSCSVSICLVFGMVLLHHVLIVIAFPDMGGMKPFPEHLHVSLVTLYIFSIYMSRLMTKPTKWHERPAKTHSILGIRPVWSEFRCALYG